MFQTVEAFRFQDNRHSESGKVSLAYRPPLSPENIPGTHFCYRLRRHQDHSAIGRIMSMENYNDTIGNRNRDLPAYSAVPQPTAPLRSPVFYEQNVKL